MSDQSDDPVPVPETPTATTRPTGRTVRMGCILLIVIGALGLFIGGSLATDPDGSQCTQARRILEDEEEEEDAGEVECAEAVSRAEALDEADEDDEVASVLSESGIRTQGLVLVGIAVLQIVGALLTMRTHARRLRVVALVGTALGIVFSPLGILGILPLGFIVYAIYFSADARAVFGEPAGLRRRPLPPPVP